MEITRVSIDAWRTLSKYHYLSHTVAGNSKFYGAFINDDLVAVVAIHKFPHPTVKDIAKVGRVVVSPKWQGYGIGHKMLEFVVENYYQDMRVRITTTLPIMHQYLAKSGKWFLTNQSNGQPPLGKNSQFNVPTRQTYNETWQYIRENQEILLKPRYQKIPKEEQKTNKELLDKLNRTC